MVGEIIEKEKVEDLDDATCVDIETKSGFKFRGKWWTVPLYLVVASICISIVAVVLKAAGVWAMLSDIF
jgi:uncharacterized membrane protein